MWVCSNSRKNYDGMVANIPIDRATSSCRTPNHLSSVSTDYLVCERGRQNLRTLIHTRSRLWIPDCRIDDLCSPRTQRSQTRSVVASLVSCWCYWNFAAVFVLSVVCDGWSHGLGELRAGINVCCLKLYASSWNRGIIIITFIW